MSELFNETVKARCGDCGRDVMTLDGWPGPVAACAECDVWTVHRDDGTHEVIRPASNGWSDFGEPVQPIRHPPR